MHALLHRRSVIRPDGAWMRLSLALTGMCRPPCTPCAVQAVPAEARVHVRPAACGQPRVRGDVLEDHPVVPCGALRGPRAAPATAGHGLPARARGGTSDRDGSAVAGMRWCTRWRSGRWSLAHAGAAVVERGSVCGCVNECVCVRVCESNALSELPCVYACMRMCACLRACVRACESHVLSEPP